VTDTELVIGAGLLAGAGYLLLGTHGPAFPPGNAGKTPYQNPNAQNISAAHGNATAQDIAASASVIGAIGTAAGTIGHAFQMGTGYSSPNDYSRNNGVQPTGVPLGSGNSQDPSTFHSGYEPSAAIEYNNTTTGGSEEQNA
jgi:hypothetical protein